jgi:hypothetical protein
MKQYKDTIVGYLIIGIPFLIVILVIVKSCDGGGVSVEDEPRQYHGGGEL